MMNLSLEVKSDWRVGNALYIYCRDRYWNNKDTNQDSILVKHGQYSGGEVLMAIVCDGMGGLSKGELASATVIRAFDKWFDEELPYELEELDLHVISGNGI